MQSKMDKQRQLERIGAELQMARQSLQRAETWETKLRALVEDAERETNAMRRLVRTLYDCGQKLGADL